MKLNTFGVILVALALAFILKVDAQPQQRDDRSEKHATRMHSRMGMKKPLKLVGTILVPGNPIRFDISWVDQARARYYLAESGNAAVDVFDAENNLFIGRSCGL